MNIFSYSPTLARAFEALGISILHSLWQGLLIMCILWILLRFIRYENAKLRFILAFGSLLLMLFSFGFTFYDEWGSLKPLPTVYQSFSTNNNPLTNLKVNADVPDFWAQTKGEAYSIFYQLTEQAHLLAIGWILGSLIFSFRLSVGLRQIHQLKQHRQSLPELWLTKATHLQKVLNIHRKVEICLSQTLDTPLTLGWLKPMILIPASMLAAMPADQLESILVHELAHIRRHDYLWNLLQSIAEVTLFYHPAYWYIASVLEQEREHACDMITLNITGHPRIYAQALLQVASLRTTLSTVGLSARGRSRSGFAERIRRIVAPQQKKKGVQPLPFLLSFCLVGVMLFAFTIKSPLTDITSSDAQIEKVDTSNLTPYLRMYDGHGQFYVDEDRKVGDINYLPATGYTSQIDYAPSFKEIMKQVPDIVLDTSSLTIGDIYNQHITIDQCLNTFQKSFNALNGMDKEKVHVNYSAPTVLYLLDGIPTNPKKITRYSVSSLAVYPAHLLKDIDTTQYKIVVIAESRKAQPDKRTDSLLPQENVSPDSLRTPDYVDYRYRLFDDKSLPEMLDHTSMSDENYIIGKAASENESVDVREYFNTSALFLLDGRIVHDPEQIHISDIRRYEVYHEPLPSALQHLSERSYSSVVRAFSQMPEEIQESSHIRIGGQVFTSENDMRLPLADIVIEVQSTGQKTTTNAQGRFSFPSVRKNDTILFHTPSHSKPASVPVDGKEYHALLSIEPYYVKRAEELKEKLNHRVKPVELTKKMGVIQESSHLPDSSMYDVLEEKILSNLKKNAEQLKAEATASGDNSDLYASLSEAKVHFTLDGVAIDPHMVDAKRIESTNFDIKNTADGDVLEVTAISKDFAEAAQTPKAQEKILFIIDDEVREDIRSWKELDEKLSTMGPHAMSFQSATMIDPSEVPSVSAEQLKKYTRVFIIDTYGPNTKPKNIARGKLIDDSTKQPLVGVEVSDLQDESLKTYTDENGEYELPLNAKTKHVQHTLEGYMPFVIVSNAVTTFNNPILMPLRKDEGNDAFGSQLKVFPNPGNDEIKVHFAVPEAGAVAFELLDKEGHSLYKKEQHYSASENHEIIIPAENLAADTFLLKITHHGESVVKRVILR